MKRIQEIKDFTSQSSFRRRLEYARVLGEEWDGRDIRYYALQQVLEKNDLQRKDNKEMKEAKLKEAMRNKMTPCDSVLN